MGTPTFKPEFLPKYKPIPFIPAEFPLAPEAEAMTFGELFHDMFMRATNLYDFLKSFSGYERPAMEAVSNWVINFVIGQAAWLDGQAASPPSPEILHAQLHDLSRQAWKYRYNFTDQRVSVSHLIKSSMLWLVPRAHILSDKANDLKMEIRAGETSVRVTAEFEIAVPVKAEDASEYVKSTACRELFMSEECKYQKLKSIKVQVPVEDDEEE